MIFYGCVMFFNGFVMFFYGFVMFSYGFVWFCYDFFYGFVMVKLNPKGTVISGRVGGGINFLINIGGPSLLGGPP